MKNPDSFKIESIEIRKDTIPSYLSNDMLSLADKSAEALEDYKRYSEMGYLFAEESSTAFQKMKDTNEALQSAYKDAKEEKPTIEYVAYVKYSGTNAIGGTVTNKAIIIIDSKDTKNVLGAFNLDSDFIKQFIYIKMIGSDFKFDLKQNKFGKYETDGLPYFEKFIIDEAN